MIELYFPCKVHFCRTYQEMHTEIKPSVSDIILTSPAVKSVLWEKLGCMGIWVTVEKTTSTFCTTKNLDFLLRKIPEDTSRIIAIGVVNVLDYAKLIAKHLCKQSPELILVPTSCEAGRELMPLVPLKSTKGFTQIDVPPVSSLYICKDLQTDVSLPVFLHGTIRTLIFAAETYVDPASTYCTRLFSKESARIILQNYRKIVFQNAHLNEDMKEDFLYASCYTGIARNQIHTSLLQTLFHVLPKEIYQDSRLCLQLFIHLFRKYMCQPDSERIQEFNTYVALILGCQKSSVYQELQNLCDCILPQSSPVVDREKILIKLDSIMESLLMQSCYPLEKEDLVEILMRIA